MSSGIVILVVAAWFFLTRIIGESGTPKMIEHTKKVCGPVCNNVPLSRKTCNVVLNERSGYQVPIGWETVRENLRERFEDGGDCPEKPTCESCAKPFEGYITTNRDIYPLYLDEWRPCPRYPPAKPDCEPMDFEYKCPKALVCPPQPCNDLNLPCQSK